MSEPTPPPAPPAIPPPLPKPSPFEEHFGPAEGPLTLLRVIDILLRKPARLVHALAHGRAGAAALALFTLLFACMTGYGLLMGSFSGGPQLWVVPLKAWLGLLFGALLCLPSLYIFACLSGGRLTLPHLAGLLLQGLSLTGLLLIGFAPILWIFSQSTHSASFMAFLHLLATLVSLGFGLRLLFTAADFLNRGRLPFLRAWAWIFILVTLQMTTFLRPLVDEFKGFHPQERQFFLAHWIESLDLSR